MDLHADGVGGLGIRLAIPRTMRVIRDTRGHSANLEGFSDTLGNPEHFSGT